MKILSIYCVLLTLALTHSSHAAILTIENRSDKALKVVQRNLTAPFNENQDIVIWKKKSHTLNSGFQEIKLLEFLEPINLEADTWKTVGFMNPNIIRIDITSKITYVNSGIIELQNTASNLLGTRKRMIVHQLQDGLLFTNPILQELVSDPNPKAISGPTPEDLNYNNH